jgi:hypothetical protein
MLLQKRRSTATVVWNHFREKPTETFALSAFASTIDGEDGCRMNRRDFLAGVTAALAASAIPPALAETVTTRVPVLEFYSPEWLDVFKNILEAYTNAFGCKAPLPGTQGYEFLVTMTDSVIIQLQSFKLITESLVPAAYPKEELDRVFGPDYVQQLTRGDW